MYLGYLIYTEYEAIRNEFFIERLKEAADLNDIDLKLVLSENLVIKGDEGKQSLYYEGGKIPKPDFVIQRTMDYTLSETLENNDIRVFNKSIISKYFDNKFAAYEKIKSLGIPVLDTYLSSNTADNLFFPNVTKPIDSKGGDRVFLNDNKVEYENNIKSYLGNDFIIQKPANTIGKDLRVYAIGKNIIAAMLRESDKFISNYTKGGSATVYNLNVQEKELINKIIFAFDFDYVGIDFLFNNGSLVFSEVETVVGARMLYDKTNIDPASLFISHIKNNL